MLAPLKHLFSPKSVKLTANTYSLVQLNFARFKHEYTPRFQEIRRAHKGRVPVRVGGSMKGCTVENGDFGLRLRSEGVRLSAKQLQAADNAIMRVVRNTGGRVYRRFSTSLAVCTKGNETRMGKGKGAFDYWAIRVPTGKILFEVTKSEDLHEKVLRNVLRIAGDKLPGVYEIVKKGSSPRVGLKKMGRSVPKTNVVEEMKKQPTKEMANEMEAKKEQYRLFRGR